MGGKIYYKRGQGGKRVGAKGYVPAVARPSDQILWHAKNHMEERWQLTAESFYYAWLKI